MGSINNRIHEIVKRSELTKTAFAKRVNVSQQYISKLTKTGEPSDLFIVNICREFNVREEWLRSGDGEMFNKIDSENQLVTWAGSVLKGTDESFKKRFVKMLIELDDRDWRLLEKMFLKLYSKKD